MGSSQFVVGGLRSGVRESVRVQIGPVSVRFGESALWVWSVYPGISVSSNWYGSMSGKLYPSNTTVRLFVRPGGRGGGCSTPSQR